MPTARAPSGAAATTGKHANPLVRDCFGGSRCLYQTRRLWLDDSHVRIPQALPKGRAYRVVRAADGEVHDLDGREDDAHHLRKGLREEVIIERARDLLLTRQGVHGLDALDYRPVEGIQLAVLVHEHRVRRQHLTIAFIARLTGCCCENE